MLKTIEQLRKLALNPFYQFTEDEKRRLIEADAALAEVSIQLKKNKGTAIAKQTGQIVKHSPGLEE